MILQDGVLPADHKMAVATPVFFKGDKMLRNNRPIITTSVEGRLLANIMREYVKGFREDTTYQIQWPLILSFFRFKT